MSFDPVNLSADLMREKIANSTAKFIANCMKEVWDFMREEMIKSQTKQMVAANHHRKEPLVYKIDNKVFLSTKNIRTEKPSKKLDNKNISPFKIKKLVGLSYQLKLSYIMKIYNVFHPNLLWKVVNNPLPGQQNSPPPLTVVNNKEKWEVDNILDVKRGKGGKKMLFWVK